MEEWKVAFDAYRSAQARVNNAAAYLTLVRWMERVGALRPNLPPAFVADAVQVLGAARRIARRLAQAWYQYGRALETGYQLGELEGGALDGTMDRLRQNFLDRLQDAAQLGHGESDDQDEAVAQFEQGLREAGYDGDSGRELRRNVVPRVYLDRHIQDFLESWGEDSRLEREPFEWRSDSDPEQLREWVERQLRETAREETRERRDRVREREREREETSSDEEVEGEHERAGQRVAGDVHEAVADAARKLTEWVHFRDSRVSWVARGTAPNPCAFCAMLASRSASPDVPNYRSVRSAMLTSNSASNSDDYLWSNGFRKVHPNCNCYPIIRWADGGGDQVPELNQEFYDLWRSTQGFNDFRRALYRRAKGLQGETASQEE